MEGNSTEREREKEEKVEEDISVLVIRPLPLSGGEETTVKKMDKQERLLRKASSICLRQLKFGDCC